jgi:serine/threonine protein kinase
MSHTLQALDYIHSSGIIHRDVKEDNIFFIREGRDGCKFRFQLGDFGHAGPRSIRQVGHIQYAAPETFEYHESQSGKMDMWSLFVTFVSVLRAWEGRRIPVMDLDRIDDHRARFNFFVNFPSTEDSARSIKEMARMSPKRRASAAQMLVKLYQGHGLTTPRNKIKPMPR